MICYLFVAAMAFFNACMDTLENENFHESIFKNWDQRFWYKRESWKYVPKILGYRPDAWHLSKTCMVFSLAGSIISAIQHPPGASWWVVLINIGLIWNLTFYLVYHKLFGVK